MYHGTVWRWLRMAESKVKDDNFFLVSGWMLNRLKLKGITLQVYSIIYGFSQDGESYFTGSLQYLSDFTNASRPTIIKALKELVEMGYILKFENEMNGVKFNKYKANLQVVKELNYPSKETLQGGSQISLPPPSKETLPNNISLDNKENIKKDIVNEVIELYHTICVSFPIIRAVSEARKKKIKNLLKKYTLEDFQTVFENMEKNDFLKGNSKDWKASFDWVLKEDNFLKVLEGAYDRFSGGRKEAVPGWMQRKLDKDELESIRRVMSEDPISNEELERLEAEQEKNLAARAERLKKVLGQEAI